MLVSVNERTREIGVSKALGASKFAIRTQYLTEAVVICQIGGFFGIMLGLIIGFLLSTQILNTSFVIPWGWIILGISFCLIVGLLAGFYPAMRASQLAPVEALRYE